MKNLSFFPGLVMLSCILAAGVTGHAQTNYYSKSTGSLNTLSTWGTNTDGTGTSPTNFTTNNRIFNVRNNASPTITANWTVSGTASKIVVGDGTNATNFQIPSAYICSGTVNVSANATLSIANTTNPTLGTLSATSTVIFNGTSNQTIPVVTYGNLTYAGSAKGTMASGGCTIAGTLSVTSGTLQMDNYSTAYTYTVGALNVTTSGLMDLGSANGYTGMGATINLKGDLIQSGSGQIYCTGNQEQNGIINFTGGPHHNIQQASSDYVNYNILAGDTCVLTGSFSFDGYPGWQGQFTVNSGGVLDCGTYIIFGYSNDNFTPDDNILTLNSGATIITANTAGIASTGTSGSIQTNSSSFSSGANYIYDGTTTQFTGIFTTTPTASTVNNLTINNSAGVTLSQSESVNGVLTLTNGTLNTTSTKLITINNAATVSGASSASFVNGPVKKIGKQAFVFPVGATGTGYIPIGISAPANTTDAFQAQYIPSSAVALGPITAVGLNHVNGCDYWTLDRVNGTATVNVTGYWNASSPCTGSYVSSLATLALAHFNGTSWNAWANNGTTGNTTAGSITWNSVSTFSPFSLASTSILNPLPLTITGFQAHALQDGTVGLSWTTTDESGVSHFAILRSSDGVKWADAGVVAARGTGPLETSYTFTDPTPLPDKDYYRLRIVDNDGNFGYSDIRVVDMTDAGTLRIFPNPASDQVIVRFSGVPGVVSLRLLSIDGRVLVQKRLDGGYITLPVSLYPDGNYLAQVVANGRVLHTEKLVIKRK